MADNSSTVQFKADISQLKSAMQQAQRQVKLANSEFKAATSGMNSWSSSAEGLKAKLKQLDTTLSSQKTQLSLLETEYSKTVTLYGENSAAADKCQIAINNMKAAINQTESQIKSYNQQLTDVEKDTGELADDMDDLDESVDNAGDGFTVFKGVLSDLIANVVTMAISTLKDLAVEVVEVGSNFESAMDKVAALSGATEEELQMLTDTAKEFGSNTKFSATEAADALSYMALAGWNAETSAEALGGVLDLAASSGMELADASDMVTDYLTAFGLSASEASNFADILSYSQGNANTSAVQLGDAYKNCAANLSAAGQDIETTTSLLTTMANQGLKGSEAGTALTAIMRDMTNKMSSFNDEAELAAAAEAGLTSATGNLNDVLGVSSIQIGNVLVPVSDLEGNYRDLTDILKDVETATNGMGDAEKASALQTTFTKNSIKGLNLILNAGVNEAADFEEQLRNCNGTAKEMSDVMNDNLSGDITQLNSKLEGIKITVYESMVPALREAVAKLSETVSSVDWTKVGTQIGELTVKAVDFLTKIMDNSDGVLSILQAIATSIGIAFAVSKILSFASTIISLYKTFQTLKTITDAATTSQLLLNAAQLATPVGIVTAAVAALAAGLVYLASKNDTVREKTVILTEAEEEQVEKINELKEAYENMSATRDESVKAISSEYDYYEQLAEELDSLVDENNQVKEGYEDRVNFILTTLNEAVGTEMELVDGVIENYQEEKDAIYDLIEAKKAEAILSANEEMYTTAIQNSTEALKNYVSAQNMYNDNVTEMEAAQEAYNNILDMTVDEYAELNDLTYDTATASQQLKNDQEALSNELLVAKAAVGQSRVAMENAKTTYEAYQTTIKNYEGLSSAIISGDSDKISQALLDLTYDFQTAETSTKASLEQQVRDYEENLESLKTAIEEGTPGVTEEMVEQAQSMVDAAKAELDKLPEEAGEAANSGAETYATTFGNSTNTNMAFTNAKDLREAAEKGLMPNGGEKDAADNFTEGYLASIQGKYSTARTTGSGLSKEAVDGLDDGQESHSPSKLTTTSGENFGQGFINGMNNKSNSIWTTAWNLAKTALNALKSGQQEGSPSKLTQQSGVFFGEGYDEGIESMKTVVKKTAGNLATTAYNSLKKSQKEGSPSELTFESGENFTQGYINGISSLTKQLQNTVKNMTTTALKTAMSVDSYDFSKSASNVADYLADELEGKTTYLVNRITKANEEKLAEFDQTIASLEERKSSEVASLQTQIDAETDEEIKATLKAQKAAVEDEYTKLIAVQNKYKDAYQEASDQMLSEFSTAMDAYSQKAQDLINDTINGISDKYTDKYNDLIGKQNSLISKLKGAGDLFSVSGAGIMTVNDITEQTKRIKEYTEKLQKIKSKVSGELFDQMASYDMDQGGAFMDRLLALSEADLEAYSKAYDEKMSVAEQMSEETYKKDFEKVSKDYEDELEDAFSSLPKTLEEIGADTMRGFVNGLTQNTDYLSEEVKTFVAGMVDTFKKELKISSPSRVMMSIGDFTGQGFVDGLKDTINNVKKTASKMAEAVSSPLDTVKTDIGSVKTSVGNGNALGGQNNNVVNNYNLTQNNTSPKSLSALETYQARRQQVALVKAMT